MTAKILTRRIWWTFALTKAASAAKSGSNLQCKFSLQCFATVIHRKSLGKGPLAPIGISKKSYRLRTVKIKELIKCRQKWEGGGSSIKLEQEVLHPHWLMLTLACLSWPAMAGPSLGGSTPTWFSFARLSRPTCNIFAHYTLSLQKKSYVQQIWFKWKLTEPELPRSKRLNVRVLRM